MWSARPGSQARCVRCPMRGNIAHMRIASENGDAVEVRVVGYQFPDAEEAKRHSWHMLEGKAAVADVSWHFHWQALTCDESERVAPWLRALAGGTAESSRTGLIAPARLAFTEPNLAFAALDVSPGRARLRVELDVEFHRDRAHWWAGEPYLPKCAKIAVACRCAQEVRELVPDRLTVEGVPLPLLRARRSTRR